MVDTFLPCASQFVMVHVHKIIFGVCIKREIREDGGEYTETSVLPVLRSGPSSRNKRGRPLIAMGVNTEQ